MALNCGITWTAKQDRLFLFLFFSQKYLLFYLALTVINLLNRLMYKISIIYLYYVYLYMYLYYYIIDFLYIAHICINLFYC